jgi:hypothetical protein
MTLEEHMAEWLKQPGTLVTPAEKRCIEAMRDAARDGVGYGWMQQVIEWEWQTKVPGGGAWGPEYFGAEIERLFAALREIATECSTFPLRNGVAFRCESIARAAMTEAET